MAASRRDWWVIGSAAVALHLRRPIAVADIDLLADPADAATALAAAGLEAPPGIASERFRSAVFGRIRGALDIEVMGGLELHRGDGWQPVVPTTRVFVRIGAAAVPVPERAELRSILLAFDRPKDRQRAALLDGP